MPHKPKRLRVLELICVLITSATLMFSQQISKTTAPCSPLAPYNKGIIEIQCKVDSARAGKQLIEILNRIKESQLNLDLVLKKIGEMQESVNEIHEQQELSGLLLPASEPTPDNVCSHGPFPIPGDALLILLGNSASFNSQFPHTIIRIKGEDVLTLSKKGGEIGVNVKIFGKDGRIIAEIKDNEFSINPNNYFRKGRPDKSTLVIYDQEDKRVLDVRFVNPSTVRFLGVLNYPNLARPLIISQTEGPFAGGMCGAENKVDFNFN